MRAYLGLGANLGNPRSQIAAAVAALTKHPHIDVIAVSSLYQTSPVGGELQPDYLNAVAAVETRLHARELLQAVLHLEQEAGRVRSGVKNEPRVLDIDILLYGDEVIEDRELQVPHPRLQERAFALVPLAEVAPQLRHPLTGKTVAEMAGTVSSKGVRRLAGGAAWIGIDTRRNFLD